MRTICGRGEAGFEEIGNTVTNAAKKKSQSHARSAWYIVSRRINGGNANSINETLIAFGARVRVFRNIVVIDRQISEMCYVLRLFRDCFFVADITFCTSFIFFFGNDISPCHYK